MNATIPPLLETLVLANRALDAARIRHVFIGGIAVSILARPRATLEQRTG